MSQLSKLKDALKKFAGANNIDETNGSDEYQQTEYWLDVDGHSLRVEIRLYTTNSTGYRRPMWALFTYAQDGPEEVPLGRGNPEDTLEMAFISYQWNEVKQYLNS